MQVNVNEPVIHRILLFAQMCYGIFGSCIYKYLDKNTKIP